ncbi:MAG: hypothetical protein H7X76_08635 [Prolixibacteraceae bacterium]|nr:hypothetical protein [Burkholderiales bacterium]
MLFYAVNRERYPVTVDITLSPGTLPIRIAGGSALPLTNGRLRVELQPYQLLAYRAPGPARMLKVETHVPPAHRELVTSQVHWVGNLARSEGEKWFGALGTSEQRLLVEISAEASAALARGDLWHARTALERQPMISIYRKLERMPPQIGDVQSK